MTTKLKIHLRRADSQATAVCNKVTEQLTDDLDKITCRRCMSLVGNETHADVAATYDVVVTNAGPTMISLIKAIRGLRQNPTTTPPLEKFAKCLTGLDTDFPSPFGLKECKDFVDAVRYGGKPQTLVSSITQNQAEHIFEALVQAGAKVEIVNTDLTAEPKQARVPVYVLYETTINNETTIEGITIDKLISEKWASLFGCYSEEFYLNDLTKVTPFLK